MKERKKKKKLSTCRSRAYYVSAGQKEFGKKDRSQKVLIEDINVKKNFGPKKRLGLKNYGSKRILGLNEF